MKGDIWLTTGRVVSTGTVGKMSGKNGYMHSKLTHLWKHHMRPIQFCLVVDDFGIKYVD